jgi:hypothetical protein
VSPPVPVQLVLVLVARREEREKKREVLHSSSQMIMREGRRGEEREMATRRRHDLSSEQTQLWCHHAKGRAGFVLLISRSEPDASVTEGRCCCRIKRRTRFLETKQRV